ncbi:MAG: hypothetical protein H7X71_05440 [Chitinophagales bacterium]|nr:hypothetical protein [Chitinophagales bacterium]
MKLDYLDNINEYGESIVRLSDFDKLQAGKFRDIIQRIILEDKNQLDLGKFDFIKPVNCSLILRLTDEDIGITTSDKKYFFCDLTISGYKNMIDLIEPFCNKESHGYQWLYEIDNPIDLLFSAGGSW